MRHRSTVTITSYESPFPHKLEKFCFFTKVPVQNTYFCSRIITIMKITATQLRRIIKEEVSKAITETDWDKEAAEKDLKDAKDLFREIADQIAAKIKNEDHAEVLIKLMQDLSRSMGDDDKVVAAIKALK